MLGDPATFTPAQRALSDRMQADWANFARNGLLDGERVAKEGKGWRTYSPTPRMGGQTAGRFPDAVSNTEKNVARHHCAFWSGIPL